MPYGHTLYNRFKFLTNDIIIPSFQQSNLIREIISDESQDNSTTATIESSLRTDNYGITYDLGAGRLI